jgi:DNA-binding beta-propeller fold protein YncE
VCRPAIFALALVALLALAQPAQAARTVYFAETGADRISQLSVAPDGGLSALAPAAVGAPAPRRLAMTPAGGDLYATAAGGVLQFDVAADGRLAPKAQPLAAAGGELHSIAVHPRGHSVYVTDSARGKVRQYSVGAGGLLAPKDPAYLPTGPGARGLAVGPGGNTLYVLTEAGIVMYDIDAAGALTRRPQEVAVPSCTLEDVALTPDGGHLYATASDGRIFEFAIGTGGTPAPLSPAAVDAPAGTAPLGIAVAPGGSVVYVAARGPWPASGPRVLSLSVSGDGLLAAADEATPPASATGPWYLTATPSGRNLLVAAGDGLLFALGPGPALAAAAPPAVDLEDARGVVVSPNQAPRASFVPRTGAAGSATRFDASAARDPDGTIVRYDWNFGDGTLLPDGGPAPEHVYAAPGVYVVTLVVTDNEGASTSTVFTGGTVLGNGAPGAQATQTVEVPAPAAQPPPAPAQPPAPDLGETLVATPVRGDVLVRRPGERSFESLETIEELPLGSVLDTRRGRVRVSTERRRRGSVQSGVFHGGLFAVRQRRRDRFVTELVLRGAIVCRARGEATAAARKRRRLWGNAKGRFRTRGRYSSGAVRGTRWLVADSCRGTLTVVRRGRVAVRDFTLRRTVVLDAGERYLARPD